MLKESLLGCHIGLLLVRDASCFACFYLVNVGTWECVWNFKLVHFVYTFGKVVLEMHKDICCLIVLCMIEASQLFTAVLRMFSEDEGFFFVYFEMASKDFSHRTFLFYSHNIFQDCSNNKTQAKSHLCVL